MCVQVDNDGYTDRNSNTTAAAWLGAVISLIMINILDVTNVWKIPHTPQRKLIKYTGAGVLTRYVNEDCEILFSQQLEKNNTMLHGSIEMTNIKAGQRNIFNAEYDNI